jgi:hypothetical protein
MKIENEKYYSRNDLLQVFFHVCVCVCVCERESSKGKLMINRFVSLGDHQISLWISIHNIY